MKGYSSSSVYLLFISMRGFIDSSVSETSFSFMVTKIELSLLVLQSAAQLTQLQHALAEQTAHHMLLQQRLERSESHVAKLQKDLFKKQDAVQEQQAEVREKALVETSIAPNFLEDS